MTPPADDDNSEFDLRASIDPADRLLLDLPTYEGPLDLLVELARAQKVDLTIINVLHIADQFLIWFRRAGDLNLELAADWLVMAATLALLKSRILIPSAKEERAAAEAAFEDLASRLRRLESIRRIVDELSERRRLGLHWHRPIQIESDRGPVKRLDANLHALLTAYVREARITLAPAQAPVRTPYLVMSVEEAIRHIEASGVLGSTWQPILSIIPSTPAADETHQRSRIAASYVAALELGKRGLVEIEQMEDEPLVRVKRREIDP